MVQIGWGEGVLKNRKLYYEFRNRRYTSNVNMMGLFFLVAFYTVRPSRLPPEA